MGAAEAQAILDGERHRLPRQRLAQPHERRPKLDLRQHLARLVDQHRAAVVRQVDHPVYIRQHALQPVLGEQDGQAQVGVEAHQGVEHILGRLGIQLRRRLVQHQDMRSQRQGGADRHALALAAGECLERPVAQRLQVQQVERLLDAHPHLLRGHGGVFQRKGDLVLDPVHDELRLGILEDKPDVAAEHLGRGRHRVQPLHAHVARQGAAAKVRHQPVDAAQQRGFARAGRADHQDQLAFGQLEAHVLERRRGGPGIRIGQMLKMDHGTPVSSGAPNPSVARRIGTLSSGHTSAGYG